ncbi:hypothetical protein LLH00_07000 [bacterium]|nr:hypothetical protein [bacterium]
MRLSTALPRLCVLLALLVLAALACSDEHNVNSANLVTVDGQVYRSRTQRTGVADVTVIVEKSEESASNSVIPDIFVRTDANGRWEAKFSLSYPDGGDVADLTPVMVEESMRILMVSPEARFLDLGGGFTFQAGKTYHIWDVYLDDFGADSTASN